MAETTQTIDVEIESEAQGAISDLDKVDSALERIEKAIVGISDKLDKLTGFDKVSRAVNRLASDIEKINPDKFGKVASEIDGLSKSADNTEQKLASMAKELGAIYNVNSKTGIKELTNAFKELYRVSDDFIKNGTKDKDGNPGYLRESENIQNLIKQYGEYHKEIDETTKAVWEYVKAQNAAGSKIGLLNLDKEFKDFASMRASLGKAFKKGDTGFNIDSFLKELNDTLGAGFDENCINGFEQLVNTVNEAKTSVMNLGDAMNSGKAIEYDLTKATNDYVVQVIRMVQANMRAAATSPVENVAEKIQAVEPAFEEATNAVKGFENALNETSKGGSVSGIADEIKKDFEGISPVAEEIEEKFEEVAESAEKVSNVEVKADTWEDVLKNVETLQTEFDKLSESIGENNAEMQNLQNIHNMLTKAFTETGKGNMLFDIDNMQKAQAILNVVDDKLKQFQTDLKDPMGLRLDASQPVNDIEKLYARLHELQDFISRMKNNKINFTDDQFKSALKEYEEVQKKIKEIEQPKGMDKANNGALEFMATVIAIQHELDKVAGLMDKFGNIAISAFKKALTPLKLFEHEFDHIKTMVLRIGSAFAMMSKPITKLFDSLRQKWAQTLSAMEKRISKLMRTFVYMGFRKIFTAIYKTMGEAIKSLAAFSKSINTDFNNSMSLLTSDLRYLGASIVAAFEPLINVIVPILDKFVDVLVEAINKINMFFTALTGAKSFTIAKKKIVDYTDAMNKASKAAKQLTMGVDELNILNDKTASGSDLDDMFDWQEIDSSAIPKSIQDAADKVKDIAKQLWNPIKEAWDNVGDYVKDSFKRMLNSIGALLKDIGRDFLEVWNQPRTVHMLEQILGILGDIFNIIANIADGWREAWNYNETGKKMLEDIRDLLDVIFTHIHNITSAMVEWTAQLDWKPLFVAIEYALQKLVYAVDQIGYVVEDLFDLFMKLGTYLIEDWAPRLIKLFGDVEEGIGNIAKQIHNAWQEVDFGTKVADGIDGIMQAILPHLEELGKYFKEWANGLDFKPLMNAFTDLLESMQPLADFVSGTLVEAFEKLFLEEIQHLVEDTIPKITKAFADLNNAVNFDKLREQMSKLIDAAQHLQHAISEGVADAIGKLGQHLAKFVNSKNFNEFLTNIANFVSRIKPDMISKVLEGIGLAILKIADGLVKFVNSDTFQNFLDSLIRFMENTSADKIADTLLAIAKAILAFKGISAAIKAISSISSVLPILMKLAEVLSPTGLLVVGLAAAAGAFVLFGDQIAAVDWTKLGKMLYEGVISLIEKIDWKNVGENLAKVIGDLLVLAFETMLNPAWRARMMAVVVNAMIDLISGLQQGIFASLAQAFENAGLNVVAGFIRGIAAAWEAIWDFIGGLIQKFIDFVKGILGIQSPSTVFAEIGTNIVLGLIEGIKEAWQLVIDFFTTCWETVKELFTTAWTEIIEVLRSLWSTVYSIASELWGSVRDFLVTIFDTVSEAWQTVWTTINEFLTEIWQGLQTLADTVFGFIRDLVVNAWNTIESLTNSVWGFVKDHVVSVLETIQATASEVIEFVRNLISEAWEFVRSITESAWSGIRDFLSSVWGAIKSTAESLFGALRSFLGSLWDGLLEAWSSIWESITSAVTNIWLAFTGKVHDIWDWVTSFLENLWNTIEGAWTSVWDSIIATITGIWQDFVGGIHDIWDGAKDFLETLWNAVKGLWADAWNGIISTIQSIWSAFIGKLQSLWQGVVSFVSNIWNGVSTAWKTVWNAITEVISGAVKAMMGFFNDLLTPIKAVMDAIKWVIDKAGAVKDALSNAFSSIADGIGGVVSKIDLHIPGFATGGFPEDGLFMANHGELVGKFSNGQTAVVNNQQITEGIREAVASAMIPILEEIATNTKISSEKDLSLSIDSREIARANNTGQSKLGRSLVTTT